MGQTPKSSNRYRECDRLIKADFHVTRKNDAMTLITFQNSALQLPSLSNFEHFSRPSSSIGQNTDGTHEGQDGQRHSPLAAFTNSIREYCGGILGVSSFHLANALFSSYECTNVKPGLLPLVGYTVTYCNTLQMNNPGWDVNPVEQRRIRVLELGESMGFFQEINPKNWS